RKAGRVGRGRGRGGGGAVRRGTVTVVPTEPHAKWAGRRTVGRGPPRGGVRARTGGGDWAGVVAAPATTKRSTSADRTPAAADCRRVISVAPRTSADRRWTPHSMQAAPVRQAKPAR